MSIYYSLVARRNEILCHYCAQVDSFESMALNILNRVPQGDCRESYVYGIYCFYVVVSSGITFLCASDASFDSAIAFTFLSCVESRWLTARHVATGRGGGSSDDCMASFSRVLGELMEEYKPGDRYESMRRQVEEGTREAVLRLGAAPLLTDSFQGRLTALQHATSDFNRHKTQDRRCCPCPCTLL